MKDEIIVNEPPRTEIQKNFLAALQALQNEIGWKIETIEVTSTYNDQMDAPFIEGVSLSRAMKAPQF